MATTSITQAANDTFAAKDNGIERTVALSNTPADFGNATAVTVTVDGSLAGFDNDTSCELDCWIETSGGTLLASDASTWKQVQSRSSNGTFTTSALSFSTINTTATKTDWDGALIRYRQSITGISMGPDSVQYTTTTSTSVGITYNTAAGEDTLTADDVESASELTTPTLGGEHGLAADDVESASELTTPALGGEHSLAADDVESASELTTPTLALITPITADDVESLSELTTPTLAGEHVLLADDVESLSELTTPALGGEHSLAADDVESLSELTVPTLAEASGTDVLLADDVESTSEVSIPTVAQSHILTADSVTSLSTVSMPTLGSGTIITTRIKLKSGTGVPTPEDLQTGELCQNELTGEFWTKNETNQVVRLGGLYWSAETQRPTTRSPGGGYLFINDGADGTSLPTTDPELDGAFWNDNGVLKVSDG